jgi:hypothetical protein
MRVLMITLFLVIVGNIKSHGQDISKLKISQPLLSLELNSASGAFLIKDSKRGRVWASAPYKKIAFINAEVLSEREIKMSMYDSSSRMYFSGLVTIESDSSISFTIDTKEKNARIDQLAFPPTITTNYTKGYLAFCYRSGGLLLAQHDTSYPAKRMMVYDNIGLDMPWIGVFDNKTGDGMMLLAETPYDVEIDLDQQNGRMWPGVGWAPSLLKFSYSRKATYVFTSSGRYVSLAKAYRSYLDRFGETKTLAQKASTKPKVEWLKGAAVVWGSTGLKFAHEASAAGIKRCLVMGQFKADTLNTISNLGYLVSNYENLEGTREGPMGYMKDTMEIAAYHTQAGKPIIGWVTEKGIEYYSRSSGRALMAVKKYMPSLLKEFPYTGRFLDVTPAFLLEDYHPAHTFTRQADKEYKLRAMEYIGNDLGLVIGGEHGKAWNASILEYLEGTMTGSFFWDDGNKPGYLVPPKDSNYMSANFKKYGADFKSRIPLWQLVFNDCVSSTWYWGDSNGWFTDVSPIISEQKDLMNILYGTLPLVWANDKCYGWDRNRSRFLQTLRNVCHFQERVAFSKLLTHEFLNSDHTLQHSTFAGGALTFINLSDRSIAQQIGKEQVVLAPRGFYASAPGFLQSKTLDKGVVITKIESDSLYSVETEALRTIGAITTKGRVTVFKSSVKSWRIVAETPESETQINLNAIIKSKAPAVCTIYALDEEGKRVKELGKMPANRIKIRPGIGIRLYDVTWK